MAARSGFLSGVRVVGCVFLVLVSFTLSLALSVSVFLSVDDRHVG